VHDDAERVRLPIVLWLHGAGSSADSLDMLADAIRRRWDAGVVPPAIVSCVSTPTSDGFYTDTGSGGWESLVGRDLAHATADRYGADPTRVALFGASMGGYGALKLLFASPNSFLGAVAISPAIFPGSTVQEVSLAHRQSVLGELFELLAARPEQRVSARLRINADAIRTAARPLFLGVGDRDEFLLADGAEHLHRQLLETGIRHHYVRWYGATHAGPTTAALVGAGLDFIGVVLTPAA
jgi:S-formylglutathione hydrolase